jgi:hemerythrin
LCRAVNNFVAEELLMAEANCPMLEQHLAEHNVLRNKFAHLVAAGNAGELHPADLYQFANEYLLKHMLEMDVACRDYLK